MQVIREIDNYITVDKPIFLALGNFDGVHLGHQKLLNEVVNEAVKNQGLATAFIFDPHPNKIINPDKVPKLITKSNRQAELLEDLGLNLVIYNSFNREISKWQPQEFVEKIIVSKLRASHIFIGFNYSFGYKGQGTPELLAQMGKTYGFKVSVIPPVEVNNKVVSSTLIREMVEMGNIKNAHQLLGHFPMIEGTVIQGEQRGTTIGFPTANLQVDEDILIPGKGVYAAKACYNNQNYNCVVNVGSKPTFHTNHPITVEAHIMNFTEDIYGETLRIYFIDKVRDEKKFNNIDELVNQITQDKELAYQIASCCSC